MTMAALRARQAGSRALPGSGEAATPFEPPRLDPFLVAALNRLCRRSLSLDLTIEGLALRIDPVPILLADRVQVSAFAASPALEFVWALADGLRATLSLPQDLVMRVLGAVEPSLHGLPGEPARTLLIELALTPLLERLEPHLGTSLILAQTEIGAASAPACPALGFRGALDGRPFAATLRLDGPSLERLERAIATGGDASDPAGLPDLPIDVAFRAGTMRLSLQVLSGLQPGDILVPDDFPLGQHRIDVIAGRRRRAAARVDAAGIHLQGALRPILTTDREFSMTHGDGPSGLGAAPEDSTLGDLEVTLVFELGRCHVDLATLRSLAPGYVFPLARDPAGPVDIYANGRRIGRGEIVRVGETLGVRATRLFGHE